MKKRSKIISVIIAAILLMQTVFAVVSYAEDYTPPTRTVMFYLVGSNLERLYSDATHNIIQILESDYNENLNFITMTGGTKKWQTPSKYLDGTDKIDPNYNQIYKMEGRQDDEEYGKMKLLEPTGIEGFEDTAMNEPEMLTAFIDYCYENFPADLYSIILWDHGGGPAYGFGKDERTNNTMRFHSIYKAFKDSKLIKDGELFDFINFDACLMGNTDVVAALSVFTDCIIASPETIPGDGESYGGWLNLLCEYPELTAYEIGITVVDDCIAYFEDGHKSTFSVYDTRNFRDRLLDLIMELDDIMLSEATTKSEINGKYNFYDELYSIMSAYEFSKSGDYALFDLGNLAGALSAPQSEFDNLTLEEVENLYNRYTDTALEILEILDDWDFDGDDVLYGDWTSRTYMQTDASFVRDLNGDLKRNDPHFITYPTGISILESKGSTLESVRYAKRMKLLIDELDDPELIEYFGLRIASTACYGAICLTGKTVSGLAQNTDKKITFDELAAELKDTPSKENETLYGDLIMLLSCVAEYSDVFNDLDEAVAYISEIIDQQYDEAIVNGEISIRRIYNEDESEKRYGIDLDGMSAQALLEVTVQQTAVPKNYDTQTFRELIEYIYGDEDPDYLYPGGIVIRPSFTKADLLLSDFIDSLEISMAELYQNVYASSSTKWTVDGISTQSIVLTDSEGGVHITFPTYLDESLEAVVIPITLKETNGKFYKTLLSAEFDEGEWQILGIIWDDDDSVANRSYTPLNCEGFEGAIFAPGAFITDSEYDYETVIPISTYSSVDLSKENWGISLSYMDNSEVEEIEMQSAVLSFTDIYGVKTELFDLLAEADKAAENGIWFYDISKAEVKMDSPVYNGEPQTPKPEVVSNGEVLTEGVDYRIIYEDYEGPGEAYMMICGMGDYRGEFYATYIISCGDHIIGEVLEEVPPTCTEDGHIQYVCEECELIVDEILPAHHVLVITEAKQPTEDEDGNIEYFTCANCGKIFSDEEGENEITLDDTILPAKGHGGDNPNTSDGAAVTATVIMALCALTFAAVARKKSK
jgi:hypothetical protein